jgi:hypothetical protein
VRWVLLDASPSSKPTEIVRLPRKTLGFFPPRRRKSQSFISALSTPRGSIDLAGSEPTASPFGTPPRRPSIVGPRPSQSYPGSGSYFPASVSTSSLSQRDSLNSEDSPSAMPSFMQRPGGVGTMGRNVRRPGPANDGLNAWARNAFPAFTIDHLPSVSTHSLNIENVTFGFKGELAAIDEIPANSPASSANLVSTPGGSILPGLNIGNAASSIESWMRKMASKTPGTPNLGPKGGVVVEGDLIELLDGAGSDDGRSLGLSAGSASSRTTPGPVNGGSGREDLGTGIRGRNGKGKSD